MVSLFNLFVNNNNKPKSSSKSSAVASHQQKQKNAALDVTRNSQKKAWVDALNGGKSYNSVGQAITDNARKMQEIANSSKNGESGGSGDGSGGYGDGGSSDGGSYGDGTSSGDSEDEAKKRAQEKARKKALASISKMKDSNISSMKKFDYNDLWNQTATKKQNSMWELKEEIFLYTFHDQQHHQYLISFNIDSDKGDIMSTAQVTFPYSKKLMEYWIPGKTTFAIVGGTFDREILFIGRVSEVNQRGEQIDMVGQNIGWKFKSYMSEQFENSICGMTVKQAVKYTLKQLGFTKGKYHIDLNGIPDIDSYVVQEDCTIERNGEQIQNVPELQAVVENIQSSDMDNYIKKISKTREVQEVADDYDKTIKMTSLSQVVGAKESYTPSVLRQNYGIETTNKTELIYEPILKKIQGKQKLEDYLVKGYSGSGEYTYEDLMQNIAAAIDAHFFIVDTTVCFMSFNALLTNSTIIQKSVMPTIEFWQLEEDSYELDISQYGYYNTVTIKYKNGTVTRCYDDLVKVFGTIEITYEEPRLDYQGAMLKAQAYLSAHIRDFGMELKATVLHTGKLYPANFIKLKNPLTMSEGLFFIQGVSVQWSADNQTLISDLDLRFGPENPDGLEVPEAGTSYSESGTSGGSVSIASGNVSANVKQAAQEMIGNYTNNDDKVLAIYNWVDQNVKYKFYTGSEHPPEDVLQNKVANCWDTAYLIYELCSAVDIKCEVWNGTYHFLDGDYGHLWNQIYYKGKMTFADTGRDSRNPIGQHGQGRGIVSGSCVAKNY